LGLTGFLVLVVAADPSFFNNNQRAVGAAVFSCAQAEPQLSAPRFILADLRYQVAIKGHYQKEWYPEDQQYYGREGIDLLPIQSSSEFTTLNFPAHYPADGQIDI